jgi:hypothetical protein
MRVRVGTSHCSIANRSAISERVAQGNSSQFNSLDFLILVRDQEVDGSNPSAPTTSPWFLSDY